MIIVGNGEIVESNIFSRSNTFVAYFSDIIPVFVENKEFCVLSSILPLNTIKEMHLSNDEPIGSNYFDVRNTLL